MATEVGGVWTGFVAVFASATNPRHESVYAGFKMSWVHGVWAVLAMSVLLKVSTAQGMEHGASTLLWWCVMTVYSTLD